MTDPYLSPDDVCKLIPGMTKVRLQDLRDRGRGPRYYKPTARTVVYRQSDVVAWIEASAIATRDQPER